MSRILAEERKIAAERERRHYREEEEWSVAVESNRSTEESGLLEGLYDKLNWKENQ